MTCCTSFATFKSGAPQFEWMSLEQLEAIHQRSKAKDFGPWNTDTEEMYRKTVVRRASKYLPMSVELAQAIELLNRHDAGEPQALPEVQVTALPTLAMLEAEDPVVNSFGTGGKDQPLEAEIISEAMGEIVDTNYETDPNVTPDTLAPIAPEGAPKDTLGPPNWAERAPAPVDENRFANLLASMDDSEDFADLERRTYRALTATAAQPVPAAHQPPH